VEKLERLLDALPEWLKDARLNLTSVLRGTTLPVNQTWAVALTAAIFQRSPALAAALRADGANVLSAADVEDAQAAAALMGMNTVYYRFRHLIGKPVYSQLKPGLRMNRMANPGTSKTQFERCALACAALAGCEVCLKAHEDVLLKNQGTEAEVHEIVRVAAAVNGAAVALDTLSLSAGNFSPND
jgi:lipoyl-dependent peroxiredoxin subunit D